MIGLRTPDAGAIRVMGLDPQVDREELHAIVGVQLQASVLPGHLKVGEILDLFHSFYQRPTDLEELTDALELAEKQDEYYRSLSGASSSGCRSRWPSSATRSSRCWMR